jgi:signal transduction histidine kinase
MDDDQDPADAAVRDLELTAELCHELSQPLTAVLANLHAARSGGPSALPAADLAKLLDAAWLSADHMRRLVRAASRGSRREPEVQERVQLARVLDDALAISADEIRGRAQLMCEYLAPGVVLGSELRLRQAFVNLIANAAQSLPERDAAGNFIAVRMWIDEPGTVTVEVRDTGAGIASEDVGDVTKPYFTTRPGRGMGLGLTITKRIIEAHAGRLQFVRRGDGGTRARVTLPCLVESRAACR